MAKLKTLLQQRIRTRVRAVQETRTRPRQQTAYVRKMTCMEARFFFPSTEGIPAEGTIFALYSAEGNIIMIGDTEAKARGYACREDLEMHKLN